MSRSNLFTGKAGEHAVASELLIRNWHVAFPEVDVGHDLLISDQDFARLRRVQVKTCRAVDQLRSYVGRFNLPLDQLAAPATPELLYVLAVFHADRWTDFVVVPREDLYNEHDLYEVGSVHDGKARFRLRFTDTAVACGKRDWSRFRDAWPGS